MSEDIKTELAAVFGEHSAGLWYYLPREDFRLVSDAEFNAAVETHAWKALRDRNVSEIVAIRLSTGEEDNKSFSLVRESIFSRALSPAVQALVDAAEVVQRDCLTWDMYGFGDRCPFHCAKRPLCTALAAVKEAK